MTSAKARRGGGDVVVVLAWLAANPVPAGPSPALSRWQRAAAELGTKAVPALLHALEFAPIDVQYSAQQALRVNGIDVWAHGYGPELAYTVRRRGKPERVIRPLLHDVSPVQADASSNSTFVGEEAPAYGEVDPLTRIHAAGQAIDEHRARMSELARVRSEAVRELLASGMSRGAIARRLGVHPNYVHQLAKRGAPAAPSKAKGRPV